MRDVAKHVPKILARLKTYKVILIRFNFDKLMPNFEPEYITNRRQRLLALFTLSFFSLLFCAFSFVLGVPILPLLFAAIASISSWGFLFVLAPDATKFFSVIGVLASCLFSLAIVYILHSREHSRRNNTMNELREIILHDQEKRDAYPAGETEFPTSVDEL